VAAAYCSSCGASVPPGSAACGACGHDVSRPARATWTDANACPNCASLLAAGAKFCRSCGERVAPEETSEAPPAEAAPPPAAPAETAAPAPADGSPPPAAPAEAAAPAPAPADGSPPPATADGAPAPSPLGASHPFAAFAPSGTPTPDEPTGPPPVVPRASVTPEPPPPPPPAPAFFTYNALPPATPPVDTSALESELQAPSPPPPAPEAPAAPPPAPPPTAAEPVASPPPKPPKSPKPPRPPREPITRGAIVAAVITAVLLIGSGVAVVLLRGGDEPQPAAAKSTPVAVEPEETARPKPTPRSDADLRRQVLALEGLMERSQEGRAAAAKGDTKAAIANRSALLKDLQALSAEVKDAKLKAGLASFTAAIRESLRQNRECGNACPAAELEKVNDLKSETVEALNPLLRKYAKTTYRGRDI
jgi:hypothetical protein